MFLTGGTLKIATLLGDPRSFKRIPNNSEHDCLCLSGLAYRVLVKPAFQSRAAKEEVSREGHFDILRGESLCVGQRPWKSDFTGGSQSVVGIPTP